MMKLKKKKIRQVLTGVVLAGLIGEPMLYGTLALATALSPVVEVSTETEAAVLGSLNSKLLEHSEDQSDTEESEAIQTKEEKLDASEVSGQERVSVENVTILGDVVGEWDFETSTLTLLSGSITNTDITQGWLEVPRAQIEHIVFEGSINVGGNGSLSELFRNMWNLETIDKLTNLDTTGVTDMSDMFQGAIALTTLDVSSFETSNVTDMSDMFGQTPSLTSITGLTSFDTGAVRSMEAMFRNNGVTNLDLSEFDTSEVNNMAYMFAQMANLVELDLSSFETTNVTDMRYMFAISTFLKNINLSTFDTRQVRNMEWMFTSTHHLESLNLRHFKTENVTDMNHMFAGTRDLKKLELDRENFDTSSVRDMSMMFAHTRHLASLDLSGFNTRAVTNMDQMFWMADALKELDLSSFETPALTQMIAMFEDANALTTLDISSFDTREVLATNRRALFVGLNALVELRLGTYTNITHSDLPHLTTTPGFLSFWKRDTQRAGAEWLISQELMSLSGNIGQTTGTWRRVPYQTSVQVKDSQLSLGDLWQAKDNFLGATNREGDEVSFEAVTVTGSVDTTRAGIYEVTYTYDGVSAKARITVKEEEEESPGGSKDNNMQETPGVIDEEGNEASNLENEPDSEEHNKENRAPLPQTGEKTDTFSVFGLIALSFSMMIGYKRRINSKNLL